MQQNKIEHDIKPAYIPYPYNYERGVYLRFKKVVFD